MTRMIDKHLAKWRKDVEADIEALRADLDELLGVLAWLDEQAGGKAPPEPPEWPEPPAEPPAEAEPEPTEAPAPEPSPAAEKGPYVRTTPEQLRDLVQHNGPLTAGEVATLTGASTSSVRPKLDDWVAKGTMVKEGVLVDGVRVHTYRIAGMAHPPLRAKPTTRRRLSVVTSSGVAQTGKRNPKVMKRRGKIKGVKGS